MNGRRSTLFHVVALSVLCLGTYLPGLTSIGLVNYQEALRLNSAVEMQERGDWIVPTRRGEAYAKKPPMMYWAQLIVAEAMGQKVDLFHLRLTAALAGWLGVIATYFVAGSIVGGCCSSDSGGQRHREAGWWSALGLATGVLYVRAARTGEIDILLVPSVVIAIGAIHAAWLTYLTRGRSNWWALTVATLASSAAAMTKGPPPLVLIALGGYCGILAEVARRPLESDAEDRRGWWGGAVGALVMGGGSIPSMAGIGDIVGVVVFALLGGVIGWHVGRLTRAKRLRIGAVSMQRTHPILVLGVSIVLLLLWANAVGARAGAETLTQSVAPDIGEDLSVLVPESPLRNIGFMAYGLLPMSGAALAGCLWLVRDRPVLRASHLVLLAWLVLGFAEFSALGKGVARYLTPLWPAVAMLGAWWFVALLGDLSATAARRARLWAGVLLVVAGLGQGAWYGYGRERYFGDRSPRGFAAALRALPGVDLDRVGAYRMTTLALEHYLGARIDRWDEAPESELFPEMVSRIRGSHGAYLLLARPGASGRTDRDDSIRARLEAAGLRVEGVEVGARWVQPPDGTPVEVLRITPLGTPSD